MYVTNKTENVDNKENMVSNIESLRVNEAVANTSKDPRRPPLKKGSASFSKYEKVFKRTHG